MVTKLTLRRAKQLIAAQNTQITELQHLAKYDELTGLYRRWVFMDKVSAILHGYSIHPDADPLSTATCLVILDVRGFKKINDDSPGGMVEGDEALQCVANAIKSVLTRLGDLYCRWGGDEFCLLLRGASKEKVWNIVRELNEILEKKDTRLSLRYAVAYYEPEQTSFEDLYRVASAGIVKVKREEKKR